VVRPAHGLWVQAFQRFVVDDLLVQLVRVYYEPQLVAGSKLEQPVRIRKPSSFQAVCP
jgi:hypothetical protein